MALISASAVLAAAGLVVARGRRGRGVAGLRGALLLLAVTVGLVAGVAFSGRGLGRGRAVDSSLISGLSDRSNVFETVYGAQDRAS